MITDDDLAALEDLFVQPGWRVLSQALEEALEVKLATGLDSCKTEQDLYFAKGEVTQLRAMLGWPDMVRRELDESEDLQLRMSG